MPKSLTALTEKQFLAQVLDLATLYHWRAYHPYLSIKSASGFPDVVLTRPGEPVLFVELKTDTGRVTPAQAAWLADLALATGTESYLWRPYDFDAIVARLRQGGPV